MPYPLTAKYNPEFVRQNMMGPNALKTLEELSGMMTLKPGMRVLDLGCGTGLTSIFLAREFGVTVFAADLWISASENYARFQKMGVDDRVIPIHTEAHDLPFADAYFDTAISIDAFHYFGHEPDYLDTHLAKLVKPGGQIGVGVPGFVEEYGENIPAEISPFVKPEYNFHSCGWWRDLWSASAQVKVTACRSLACCSEAWADWLASDNPHAISDREMIKAEGGRLFNLVGMVAERN
jgi:cyclopropane fatty-acyl-phospholipid synthase-like methyltransferase